MKLASPLALSALLLIPVLIIIYMLKSKKTDFYVSSIKLWEKIAQDTQVQKPWQKLVPSLLLILQIIMIALFAFVLARPSILQNTKSNDLILVIDSSLSMKASDERPTRIGYAKDKAIEMVSKKAKGGKISLIAVSSKAEILSLPTTDHKLIKEKILRLEPKGASTDIASALVLANGIASLSKDSEIALFSDGGDLRYFESDNPVSQTVIGKSAENIFVASTYYEFSRVEPDKIKVFAEIGNNGKKTRKVLASIYNKDMRLLDAKEITVMPGKTGNVEFSEINAGYDLVFIKAEAEDILPDDNSAWINLEKRAKPKVLIYSKGNLFLEKAFEPLSASVTILKPDDLDSGHRKADIFVFDGFTPKELPVGAKALFVNPSSGNEFFSLEDDVDYNVPQTASMTSLLLGGTDLLGINVLKSKKLKITNWSETVIDGKKGPLVISGEKGSKKIIAIAFDLGRSDFPLQFSFPIFIANSIDFFLKDDQENKNVLVGENVRLPSWDGDIDVKSPSGKVTSYKNASYRYIEFDETGSYELDYKKNGRTIRAKRIIAGLIGSKEANVSPSPLKISLKSPKKASSINIASEFELWKPLLLLILGAFIIEWIVYLRYA